MPFVVKGEYEVKWPVTVNVPRDGGGFDQQRCKVTFKAMPMDEAKGRRDAIDELPESEQDEAHTELLMDTMTGWDELVDEGKNPLPFSRENLRTVLQLNFVLMAFVKAYSDAFSGAGKQKRRRGN